MILICPIFSINILLYIIKMGEQEFTPKRFKTFIKNLIPDKYLKLYQFLKERRQIILRFREKKNKRIWRKKIRYFCRKNLADSRIRVKGRFVKKELNSVLNFKEKSKNGGLDSYISSDEDSESESKSENKDLNTEIASDINQENLNELKNSNNNLTYSSMSSDDPLYIFPQEKRIRRHSIAY